MKQTHTISILGAAILAGMVFILAPGHSQADTIKLKDGKTLEGKIVLEAADMLKIKIQKSASISETVSVMMSDVAEVIKSAPDDVDFAKMKNLLPTPSLMTASAYRSWIEKEPQAFLNAYPDSKHRPEVEKIKKELEDELAKVEQGSVKLEGDWLSPKSQRDFRQLIDARILNLQMRQKAQDGNFIGALRDYERLEEVYYGTPTLVEGTQYVLQLLPSLGQRIQRMGADVDFQNTQFQENLMKMPEAKRQVVIDARKREEDLIKQRFEADKSAGIKWYALNQRDKEDLNAYIELVTGEITRLKSMDLVAMQAQAETLVKVDELLAEGKLAEAKELLKEGGSTGSSRSRSGGASTGYGKGGSRSRSNSSSKSKTSYITVLREKIAMKEEAIAAAKAQAEDSAAGAAATQAIRSEDVVAAATPAVNSETAGNGESSTDAGTGALTDLIASTPNAPDKKGSEKSGKLQPKKPASKKKTADRDDEDEDEPRRTVSSGGFKWSFQKIIIGVAVLMALIVGLMKILGIGGAKG